MNPHVSRRMLLAVALCAACADAAALTARIDDRGTVVEGMTRMFWRQIAPSRKTNNTMEGVTQIRVRLNLAPWLGRSGRIFMILPAQPMGQMRASWAAHGRFLAGELLTGQRALVYAGPINSPIMEEMLLLKLEVDGLRMEGVQHVDFNFEIDLDP